MPADERELERLGDMDVDGTNEQTPTRAQHRASVTTPTHGYDLPDFNAFSLDDTPPSLRPGPPNRMLSGENVQVAPRTNEEIAAPALQPHGVPPQIRPPSLLTGENR